MVKHLKSPLEPGGCLHNWNVLYVMNLGLKSFLYLQSLKQLLHFIKLLLQIKQFIWYFDASAYQFWSQEDNIRLFHCFILVSWTQFNTRTCLSNLFCNVISCWELSFGNIFVRINVTISSGHKLEYNSLGNFGWHYYDKLYCVRESSPRVVKH